MSDHRNWTEKWTERHTAMVAKHNGKADKVQYGGQANQGVCLREEKKKTCF